MDITLSTDPMPSLSELPDLELRLLCEMKTWVPLMPLPSPQMLTLRLRGGVLRVEVADSGQAPKTALVVNCGGVRERAPQGVLVLDFAACTASRPIAVACRLVEDNVDDLTKHIVRDEISRATAHVQWLQQTEAAKRTNILATQAVEKLSSWWHGSSASRGSSSGAAGHSDPSFSSSPAPPAFSALPIGDDTDADAEAAWGGGAPVLVALPESKGSVSSATAWGGAQRWAVKATASATTFAGKFVASSAGRDSSHAHQVPQVVAVHAAAFPLTVQQLATLARVASHVLPSGVGSVAATGIAGLSRYASVISKAAMVTGGAPIELEVPVTVFISVKVTVDGVSLAILPWDAVEVPRDFRIIP